MEVLRALYVCASGLRFSGRSRQEYTASLLEPELPGNRTRDRTIAKAGAQTTRQLPKTILRVIERERFDVQDLRRGFAETKPNSHSATARAHRHARSPHRIHPCAAKTPKKTSTFCTSTPPNPAQGRAGAARIAKTLEFLHLDHADPRRGLRGQTEIAKKTRACTFTRSPQRVARADKKNLEFCADHAEGRAGRSEIAKNLELTQKDLVL